MFVHEFYRKFNTCTINIWCSHATYGNLMSGCMDRDRCTIRFCFHFEVPFCLPFILPMLKSRYTSLDILLTFYNTSILVAFCDKVLMIAQKIVAPET